MASWTFADVLTRWSLQPGVVAGLAVAALWYGLGLARRRGSHRSQAVVLPRWRVGCYYAGLAAVALALLSSIDQLAQLLFAIHMVQHLLLQIVAPPLILLGRPVVPYLWALSPRGRAGLARLLRPSSVTAALFGWLARPAVAFPLFIVATWVWHLPPLYDTALRHEPVHALEHALFFGTALLFWWPVIHPSGGRRHLPRELAPIYLFAANMALLPVGTALTFASAPIYPYYAALPRLWGISAITDQQVGGLIMWVGGGLVLTGQAVLAFFAFFVADERAAEGLA